MTWSYFAIFLFGLSGSWHCVLMCGPLCGAACKGKQKSAALYFLSRTFAYVFLGFASGLMGAVAFDALGNDLHRFVALAMAAALVSYAVLLVKKRSSKSLQVRQSQQDLQSRTAQRSPWLLQVLKSSPFGEAVTAGLLTGLLPCGFLYMALLQAAAFAHPVHSALAMLVFAAATSPSLWGGQKLLKLLAGRFSWSMQKISAVLVVLSATFLLLRAFASFQKDKAASLPCHEFGAPVQKMSQGLKEIF